MISQRLNIPAMSVNTAWQGKRFKTPKYISYEKAMSYLLKNGSIGTGNIELYYKIGFSSKLSDLGNAEKQLTDILCKHYGFDDRNVFRIVMEKEIVKKNEEYIYFEIKNI